ncbi:hypothetical protein NVP1210O_23 [Vibrio phage 1.210.O._10N.222.52.C2]|nr:hypothetical protein NVP1210O_23 [Vibrio phage 1.210.O._10N.222.52.C2]
MNAQQMHDVVIKPTLELMAQHGNYNTIHARQLLLGTLAIESDMGLYNRQLNGPAVSPFQIEPPTIFDIAKHWDAFPKMVPIIKQISMLHMSPNADRLVTECEVNMRLACLIARGKYAMDSKRLPSFDDKRGLYDYYKRVFNSEAGASTWTKWCDAWRKNKLDEVVL